MPDETTNLDLWFHFQDACRRYSGREAFRVAGRPVSYAGLASRVSGLCQAFDDAGLAAAREERQSCIAALLPNDHALFELFFVAAGTRSALLPLNTRLSAQELSRILASGRPRILIIDHQWHSLLESLDLPRELTTVMWVGGTMPLPSGRDWYSLSYESITDHAPTLNGAGYRAVAVENPGGLTVEVFNTSGTTGRPKMVPHTHANVLQHLRMTQAALPMDTDDACWGHFGPMYHVGDVAFVWAATLIGARHVFHPRQLRFEDVAHVMADQRVSMTKLVPTMLRFLVQSEAVRDLSFPALQWILTGGDQPERSLIEHTEEVFGCQFIQGYGMTEATCHVAFRNESEHDEAGGLTPLDGLELRILGADGTEQASGELGEIAIRGPNVFPGYIDDEQENRTRFTPDGFFRSGDLGSVNGDGLLQISGRKKDMIIVGGENVFAHDVEVVASAIPGVRASAAVGMPDAVFGEVVVLAIVPDDATPSEDSIIRHLRSQLASFKAPQRVFVFDSFPMTPTGKIMKHEIRAEISRRVENQAAAARSSAQGGSSTASRVRDVLAEALGRAVVDRSDPDRSLMDLDVDSLGMASLIVGLEKEFAVDLPYWFILERDSINKLIEFFSLSPEAQKAMLDRKSLAFEAEPQVASAGADQRQSARPPAGLTAVRRFVNGLLQSAGLLLRPGLAVFSLLPVVWLTFGLAKHLGLAVTFALAPILLFASSVLAMLFLTGTKWLILGRLEPGMYPSDTPFFYRWLMVHNLFASTASFLGVYRGTPVVNVFFRACGARIGRGCWIQTLLVTEPDLVEVGHGAQVERNASLQACLATESGLELGPIAIGERAVVSFGAALGPGSKVDPQGYVAPLGTAQDPDRRGHLADVEERWPVTVASFLFIGYLCAAALLLAFLFTESLLSGLGIELNQFHFYGPLGNTALVLGAVAMARFGVLPLIWFALVVIVKRLMLQPLKPDTAWQEQGAWRRIGHSVYGRLIDVPFFDWALQLTNMSVVTVMQFRLLGAHLGRHLFFTAPYTTVPELLWAADEAMVAGNVSLFPARPGLGKASAIRLEHRATVANSAVLYGGTHLGQDSLLGDLSVAPPGFILQPKAIAAGNPPRIIGRSDFDNRKARGLHFAAVQVLLVALQLVFGLGATILSWMAMAPVIGLFSKAGPYWWEFFTVGPLLLLAPGIFTLAAIPLAKFVLVRRFRPGDYLLFGWLYARWVLLETLLGRIEESVTSQFNGTLFARFFYQAMGARVGSSALLMGSPIGGEFDLKEIGDGAVLNHQSKIFAHSIKRHSLIFDHARVEPKATLQPFAIVEAGATVKSGYRVGNAVAFHAAQDSSGKRPYEKRYINLREVEALAARDLPQAVFDYFSGGASDEVSLRRNESIYSKYLIVPRVLRGVGQVDCRSRFLETEISLPLMVAPMAMQKLAHSDGECGIARAAGLTGIPYILSCLATTDMEDIAALGRQGRLLPLLQFYCLRDRVAVGELIARAERAGFRGLVLTVDAPVSGKREQDMRNRFAVDSNIRFPNLEGLANRIEGFELSRFDREIDPDLKWDVLDWIRGVCRLPVFLKGILSHRDAVLAARHGAAGIIVSNHGGRQLDTTPAALEVLPEIRQALQTCSSRFPVYIDGGIRRGTDVFKSIALGADGVLIGRPCVYGLAVDGYAGAARVLNILKEEFLQTMRLAGCRSIREILPEHVRVADETGTNLVSNRSVGTPLRERGV